MTWKNVTQELINLGLITSKLITSKRKQMKLLVMAALFLGFAANQGHAQINAGAQQPEASLPFNLTQITTLRLPWRIAFLPDGRMLITEKVGGLWLVTQQGAKTAVTQYSGRRV